MRPVKARRSEPIVTTPSAESQDRPRGADRSEPEGVLSRRARPRDRVRPLAAGVDQALAAAKASASERRTIRVARFTLASANGCKFAQAFRRRVLAPRGAPRGCE